MVSLSGFATVAHQLFYLYYYQRYEKSYMASAYARIDVQLFLSDEYLIRVCKMTYVFSTLASFKCRKDTRCHMDPEVIFIGRFF